MMAYAEALDDLSPEELEIGCREASRTAEQFPKPGHIRKALEENRPQHQFLGPRLEWDPKLEQERAQRAVEWQRQLQEYNDAPQPSTSFIKQRIAHVAKPITEQKEELRKKGWLQ